MKLKTSLENRVSITRRWLANKSLKLTANSVVVFGKTISGTTLGGFSIGCISILLTAAYL